MKEVLLTAQDGEREGDPDPKDGIRSLESVHVASRTDFCDIDCESFVVNSVNDAKIPNATAPLSPTTTERTNIAPKRILHHLV